MVSFQKVSKAIESACKLHGVELTSERLEQGSIIPLVSAEVVKELSIKPKPAPAKKAEKKDVEKGVTKKEDRPVMSAAK